MEEILSLRVVLHRRSNTKFDGYPNKQHEHNQGIVKRVISAVDQVGLDPPARPRRTSPGAQRRPGKPDHREFPVENKDLAEVCKLADDSSLMELAPNPFDRRSLMKETQVIDGWDLKYKIERTSCNLSCQRQPFTV
jgi:hypothetical protein